MHLIYGNTVVDFSTPLHFKIHLQQQQIVHEFFSDTKLNNTYFFKGKFPWLQHFLPNFLSLGWRHHGLVLERPILPILPTHRHQSPGWETGAAGAPPCSCHSVSALVADFPAIFWRFPLDRRSGDHSRRNLPSFPWLALFLLAPFYECHIHCEEKRRFIEGVCLCNLEHWGRGEDLFIPC